MQSIFRKSIQTPLTTITKMDLSIEKKLKSLWSLQEVDSKLDQLSALRGELPLEVSDLEDEIAGLHTRLENIKREIDSYEDQVSGYRNKVKQSEQFILKFKQQLNEVKNNREFEALSKEIEIMELEIIAAQKRMGEAQLTITNKTVSLDETQANIDARTKDLELKKEELVTIVQETEEEEAELLKERTEALSVLEERLVNAYERIRRNAKNGVAIAPIMRNSCGGCFAKIPPQRQSDIRQHIKITDCEHCGRVIVDSTITGIQSEEINTEEKPKRRLKKRLGVAG